VLVWILGKPTEDLLGTKNRKLSIGTRDLQGLVTIENVDLHAYTCFYLSLTLFNSDFDFYTKLFLCTGGQAMQDITIGT